MLYYLADGVYPQYPIFARPFSRAASNTLKRRTYNRLHEALRKDVERLYEVTTARFHILLHPAEFHSVDRIVRPAKAVAILHNMVVVSRRDGYVSRGRMGDAYGEPDKAFAVLAAARAAAEAAEAAESDGPAAGGSAGGAAAESDGSEDNGRGRDRPYRVSGPAGASGAGGGGSAGGGGGPAGGVGGGGAGQVSVAVARRPVSSEAALQERPRTAMVLYCHLRFGRTLCGVRLP